MQKHGLYRRLRTNEKPEDDFVYGELLSRFMDYLQREKPLLNQNQRKSMQSMAARVLYFALNQAQFLSQSLTVRVMSLLQRGIRTFCEMVTQINPEGSESLKHYMRAIVFFIDFLWYEDDGEAGPLDVARLQQLRSFIKARISTAAGKSRQKMVERAARRFEERDLQPGYDEIIEKIESDEVMKKVDAIMNQQKSDELTLRDFFFFRGYVLTQAILVHGLRSEIGQNLTMREWQRRRAVMLTNENGEEMGQVKIVGVRKHKRQKGGPHPLIIPEKLEKEIEFYIK